MQDLHSCILSPTYPSNLFAERVVEVQMHVCLGGRGRGVFMKNINIFMGKGKIFMAKGKIFMRNVKMGSYQFLTVLKIASFSWSYVYLDVW